MSIHVTESLLQKFPKREEGRKERGKRGRRTSITSDGVSGKSSHIKRENNINITHIYQKDENVRL